jgi:hypothetical protein
MILAPGSLKTGVDSFKKEGTFEITGRPKRFNSLKLFVEISVSQLVADDKKLFAFKTSKQLRALH